MEPDLAERWETPDDTTYIFHLRQGVKWHNKPPVNGRELVAEDVKFTFDRFLTEKANADRYMLEAVDRVEVVDRYTVKFLLKEPYVWLVNVLATPRSMWIIAPEVVQQFGDLKKAETAIGTGPFLLERYEPNVKTVFKRNPDYFRQGSAVRGWGGVVGPRGRIDRAGHVPHRANRLLAPGTGGHVRQQDLDVAQEEPSAPALPGFPVQRDRARSTCAPISRPSTMCGCGVPSPMPLIGRRLIEAVWGPGVNRHRPSLPAWPSGRCPSTSSARERSTISTIPRKPGACWRKPAIPRVLRHSSHVTAGYGRDLIDAVQLIQRYLKDVGIEAELKLQEYGAYMATTFAGQVRGHGHGSHQHCLGTG